MVLLEISLQYRVIIGISAMLILFISFMVAFISNQRKKIQYHKNIQAVQEAQQQQLQHQNALLEDRVRERTAEINEQKEQLQNTLTELEASQLQLIQKEKMASLGELTAGIAHEMQNPLNFVNNFSDINSELLSEIKEKLAEASLPESVSDYINPIIGDLQDNLHKILQHGKRADSIVKNMLLHSQTNSGTIELTDLNALADEYLKLSFYGYRAKNKSFNCKLETSWDSKLTPVHIIPQDIGRILINLYNNAFYSTHEKKKNIEIHGKGETYEPVLLVKTFMKDHTVAITIRDNGVGIPQQFLDKIFQPFFTTKPTGGNTGLGLSLSYDIIKAHQGKITVESVEGEYAAFTVELSDR